MRLQSFGRRILSVNVPAAVGWFWFDYLSLSQAVTEFGHWRLSGSTAWIFHSFQLVISAALGVLEVE